MTLWVLVRGMHREFCESSSSKIPLTRRLVKHTKLQIRTYDNLQNSCVAVRPCITILTRTKTKPVLFSFFVCTIRIGLKRAEIPEPPGHQGCNRTMIHIWHTRISSVFIPHRCEWFLFFAWPSLLCLESPTHAVDWKWCKVDYQCLWW